MADLLLTAMVSPNNQITYCTPDGFPYRADPVTNTVLVRPQHVTYLTGLGFTTATAAQVTPGNDLSFDTGWPVSS